MDAHTAVERALPVFRAVKPGDWEALYNGLEALEMPERTANAVAAFMPLAFARNFMDGLGIRFSLEYVAPAPDGGMRTAGELAAHPVFAAAHALARRMVREHGAVSVLAPAALWSSELSLVNQALHAGSNPADLVLMEPAILDDVTAPEPGAPLRVVVPSRAVDPPRPWWKFWG